MDTLLTPKQKKLRTDLLRRIHTHYIYKTVYACDEETKEEMWRPFLWENYGVRTSAELTIPQLIHCLDLLSGRKRGKFKPSGIKPASVRPVRVGTRKESKISGMVSFGQQCKINALRQIIRWEFEDGYERFCHSRLKTADEPKTDRQADMIINALRGMFGNQMKKKHGDDWMNQQYDDFNIMRYIELHRSEGVKHAEKRRKTA